MNSNSPLLLLFRRTTVTMGRPRPPAHPTVYDAIAKIVHPDDGDGNDGDGNPVFVA